MIGGISKIIIKKIQKNFLNSLQSSAKRKDKYHELEFDLLLLAK